MNSLVFNLKKIVFFILLFELSTIVLAQNISSTHPEDSIQRKRKNLQIFSSISVGMYGMGLLGMNQLWYQNQSRTSFHFFNDNSQWMQVDKVGHGYTAFYLSELNYRTLRKIGLPEKKAIGWGSGLGFLWMLPIEILDGFSATYGASYGDLMANFSGSALFLIQKLSFKEILIRPKFTFRRSSWASQRPEVLGENLGQEILKDYNAQIYRLSFNVKKITHWKNYPCVLNLAIGYGAGEMLYGKPAENQLIGLKPYRRYFLGLDWHFSNIPTQKRFWKSVFYILDMVSLPAPTLELRKGKKIKFRF